TEGKNAVSDINSSGSLSSPKDKFVINMTGEIYSFVDVHR
ncbi:22301_t:CDS:1, partial [Racocetra persica]